MPLHHSPVLTSRSARMARLGGSRGGGSMETRVSGSGGLSTGSARRSSRCCQALYKQQESGCQYCSGRTRRETPPPTPGGSREPKPPRPLESTKRNEKSQKAKPAKAIESQLWRAMDRRKPFGISTCLRELQRGVGPNPAKATESHDTNSVSEHTQTGLGPRPLILQPRPMPIRHTGFVLELLAVGKTLAVTSRCRRYV